MSRCWAHNQDKVRCSLDAGHDQLHTVYITWRDDECYEPEKTVHTLVQPAATAVSSEAAPVKALPPLPPTEPSACVACKHRHKGGECKCGCHEHIG